MKSVLFIFLPMVVVASLSSFATADLVCNTLKAAKIRSFTVKGAIQRKGATHDGYWSITNDQGKVWKIVDLNDEATNYLRSLSDTRVIANVKCVRQDMLDEVSLIDILAN